MSALRNAGQPQIHGRDVFTPETTGYPEAFCERYVREGFWKPETFRNFLSDLGSKNGAAVALYEGENKRTYAELKDRVIGLMAGLTRLGLKKGDHAVVQLPNSIAFVETALACLTLGIVPVFALCSHRKLEITQFAQFVNAKAYFIVDQVNGFDHQALAREVADVCPTLRHVIVCGETCDFVAYDSLFAGHGDVSELPGEDPDPGAVAVFQISGGTTGVPKLIPRRHMEYLYNMRTCADLSSVTDRTVYLCALPAAHNFFFACPGLMGVLMQGGSVVFASDPSPETCFPLIARYRVTMTALVPPAALLWLDGAATTTCDLSSLQLLQVGGSKLNEEPARRVEPTLKCRLQQVFGMAEGLICFTRLDDSDDIVATTQGRPISAGDELRVVDENLQDVPDGTPGELLVRGAYTIRGYYNLPDHNGKAFTAEGFYRSGDIVRMLPGGYLSLCGREKDHINRGGEKIGPDEVENLLMCHENVHDAAVVGLPDAVLGERVAAFVILSDQGATPLALKRFLRDKGLGAYKLPDQFVFVDRFPETGVGKVSKKDLREKLKALYGPTPAPADERRSA